MMPPVITLVLAGAPKGKGRPRFSKATGHAFTPDLNGRLRALYAQ